MPVTPDDIEEKYAAELATLRGMPEDVSVMNTALLLRSVIAVILSPLAAKPELMERTLELVSVDLKSIGYLLDKDPDFVPEEEEETQPTTEG